VNGVQYLKDDDYEEQATTLILQTSSRSISAGTSDMQYQQQLWADQNGHDNNRRFSVVHTIRHNITSFMAEDDPDGRKSKRNRCMAILVGVGATLLVLSLAYVVSGGFGASVQSADSGDTTGNDGGTGTGTSNSTVVIPGDAGSHPSHVPVPPGQKRKAAKPPLATTNREGVDPLTDIIDTSLFDSVPKPFPTGAFWTNFAMMPPAVSNKEGGNTAPPSYDDMHNRVISYPVAALPYAMRWGFMEGLQISYPSFHRKIEPKVVSDVFYPDMTMTVAEGIAKREIPSHDLLSATLRFYTNSADDSSYAASPTAASTMDVYIVQGSPYVTTKYTGSTPMVTPLSIYSEFGAIGAGGNMDTDGACNDLAVQGITGSQWQIKMTGTQFVLGQPEGLTWLLMASDSITLSLDCASKRSLKATQKFTGVLRLAVLPPGCTISGSAAKQLMAHSSVYPTGGNVITKYKAGQSTSQSDLAEVQFSYTIDGATSGNSTTELLMLSLPHLTPILENEALDFTNFDGEYKCIKGKMTPVRGNILSFTEKLTSFGFTNKHRITDTNVLNLLKQTVARDLRLNPPTAEDSYGFGKEICRLANLALIASEVAEVDDDDLLDQALEMMKKYLKPWLDGTNKDALLYDSAFGGIITTLGLYNKMADFGNGRYNDHHFHYGYFAYACAVVGKFDASFVEQYGDVIDAIVADVANDDAHSPYFPIARHKSWYDGHSWASGLFPQGNGKSQESSSEAVNCYYGVYLWSIVRGDQYMNYFARLLLATEIRGARTYWQTGPDSDAYPSEFAENYMVGNLGGLDVNSLTWFGDKVYYVHGIQMIPITAITEELLRSDYVSKEYKNIIAPVYDNVEVSWKGFFVCDLAIIDPSQAWINAQDLLSAYLDVGLSSSQIYYWIATRPGVDPAAIDAEISAGGKNTDKSCMMNTGCAPLGLVGDCCPTPEGNYLGCCTKASSCDVNPGCASLNLGGDCCPTGKGVFLGCCT